MFFSAGPQSIRFFSPLPIVPHPPSSLPHPASSSHFAPTTQGFMHKDTYTIHSPSTFHSPSTHFPLFIHTTTYPLYIPHRGLAAARGAIGVASLFADQGFRFGFPPPQLNSPRSTFPPTLHPPSIEALQRLGVLSKPLCYLQSSAFILDSPSQPNFPSATFPPALHPPSIEALQRCGVLSQPLRCSPIRSSNLDSPLSPA